MDRAARISPERYQRLSPKAKARQDYLRAVDRDAQLTMAEHRARAEVSGEWVQPAECMTGDGNVPVEDTALCRLCMDRPRGEIGQLHGSPDICPVCYSPNVEWTGNSWMVPITCGYLEWPRRCRCRCHESDVWIA